MANIIKNIKKSDTPERFELSPSDRLLLQKTCQGLDEIRLQRISEKNTLTEIRDLVKNYKVLEDIKEIIERNTAALSSGSTQIPSVSAADSASLKADVDLAIANSTAIKEIREMLSADTSSLEIKAMIASDAAATDEIRRYLENDTSAIELKAMLTSDAEVIDEIKSLLENDNTVEEIKSLLESNSSIEEIKELLKKQAPSEDISNILENSNILLEILDFVSDKSGLEEIKQLVSDKSELEEIKQLISSNSELEEIKQLLKNNINPESIDAIRTIADSETSPFSGIEEIKSLIESNNLKILDDIRTLIDEKSALQPAPAFNSSSVLNGDSEINSIVLDEIHTLTERNNAILNDIKSSLASISSSSFTPSEGYTDVSALKDELDTLKSLIADDDSVNQLAELIRKNNSTDELAELINQSNSDISRCVDTLLYKSDNLEALIRANTASIDEFKSLLLNGQVNFSSPEYQADVQVTEYPNTTGSSSSYENSDLLSELASFNTDISVSGEQTERFNDTVNSSENGSFYNSDDAVLENTFSENTASENTVSEDTASENTVSEDTALENTLLGDTVSENTVLEDIASEDTAGALNTSDVSCTAAGASNTLSSDTVAELKALIENNPQLEEILRIIKSERDTDSINASIDDKYDKLMEALNEFNAANAANNASANSKTISNITMSLDETKDALNSKMNNIIIFLALILFSSFSTLIMFILSIFKVI